MQIFRLPWFLLHSDSFSTTGNDELDGLNCLEPSPLVRLTSDGALLSELLQTLESGGDAGVPIFSDSTIDAIMGDQMRSMAAEIEEEMKSNSAHSIENHKNDSMTESSSIAVHNNLPRNDFAPSRSVTDGICHIDVQNKGSGRHAMGKSMNHPLANSSASDLHSEQMHGGYRDSNWNAGRPTNLYLTVVNGQILCDCFGSAMLNILPSGQNLNAAVPGAAVQYVPFLENSYVADPCNIEGSKENFLHIFPGKPLPSSIHVSDVEKATSASERSNVPEEGMNLSRVSRMPPPPPRPPLMVHTDEYCDDNNSNSRATLKRERSGNAATLGQHLKSTRCMEKHGKIRAAPDKEDLLNALSCHTRDLPSLNEVPSPAAPKLSDYRLGEGAYISTELVETPDELLLLQSDKNVTEDPEYLRQRPENDDRGNKKMHHATGSTYGSKTGCLSERKDVSGADIDLSDVHPVSNLPPHISTAISAVVVSVYGTMDPPPEKRRGRKPKNVQNSNCPEAQHLNDRCILSELLAQDPSLLSLSRAELKKLVRKEKNRRSAKLSRQKLVDYTASLERKVKALQKEQETLLGWLKDPPSGTLPHRIFLHDSIIISDDGNQVDKNTNSCLVRNSLTRHLSI